MHSRSFGKTLGMLLAFGLAAVLVGVLAVTTGCSSPQQSSTEQSSSQASARRNAASPLKVGVQYNALSLPTVFAEEYGYFSEAGLDAELYTYANGADENKALEDGEIDIASDSLASAYMLATGLFSWIGESDDSAPTVAIYVREDSPAAQVSGEVPNNPNAKGSADTLRGLTVLGPAGTMEEWVTVSYFSQFGLTVGEDYDFIEMERAEAADSVVDGLADAFVATDADYCRIMEENGFVALASGTEATMMPLNNGYLVNNKVLHDRYDDIVVFLRAVYRAAEVLNNDPALRSDFSFEYYRANGKPTMRADVTKEAEVRPFFVPDGFTSPDYRLGSSVLDAGAFNASFGALEDRQVLTIENSINTQVLKDAFGIDVQRAMLGDGLQSSF